eukprot:NODE_636_length_1281_cov_137.721591_g502_i0.p1 GENE.NODE_636_length_1281_cov_137.721591_g502_i0~~NODE_636_length_1281_cov_137.721591_g502_i0.p1  ORF type:complete len:268 (-),score=91.77 NODE_636_length_1281_cov_137.721591_g502_i0:477-1214(-)
MGHHYMEIPNYLGCFRRRLPEISHFTEKQLQELYGEFVKAAGEDGSDEMATVLLNIDTFTAFMEAVLPLDLFAPKDDGEDSTLANYVVGFLKAIRPSLFRLASDPSRSLSNSPGSQNVNRFVRFHRFVEVLNTCIFGAKPQIVEFLTLMICFVNGTFAPTQVTLDDLLGLFHRIAQESGQTDSWAEEKDDLRAEFAELFGSDGKATVQQFRANLEQFDLFNTWNTCLLPLLQKRGWRRCNPILDF